MISLILVPCSRIFLAVVNSVSKLYSILEVLDTTTVCMGDPDQDLAHQRGVAMLHLYTVLVYYI